MRKILKATFAVVVILASWPAYAVDSTSDWVLLSIGWSNGSGAYSNNKGMLPEFANWADCTAALHRALAREAHLSHAEGGGNGYKCIRVSDWQY